MNRQQLYEDGIEEAKKAYAAFENMLFIALFVLGFMGMFKLTLIGLPLVSVSYALFIVIMLGFVLRKHLCTQCYYYDKWCHCGWGKLSSAMFKKDAGNQELGGKLAQLTWGIIMGVPIIGMAAVIIMDINSLTHELLFLVPFVILVAINGVLHVKDCRMCKMRFICPGSGAKKK